MPFFVAVDILFLLTWPILVKLVDYFATYFFILSVGEILDQLSAALDQGFSELLIQKTPHITLLSVNFYEYVFHL